MSGPSPEALRLARVASHDSREAAYERALAIDLALEALREQNVDLVQEIDYWQQQAEQSQQLLEHDRRAHADAMAAAQARAEAAESRARAHWGGP